MTAEQSIQHDGITTAQYMKSSQVETDGFSAEYVIMSTGTARYSQEFSGIPVTQSQLPLFSQEASSSFYQDRVTDQQTSTSIEAKQADLIIAASQVVIDDQKC